MSINREMLADLKHTLRERIGKNNISSFGVSLRIKLYGKGVTSSQDEITTPVLMENNKIKGLEIVKMSLTRTSKLMICIINHGKKTQRTCKAHR